MSNPQPIQLHLLGSFSITSDKKVLSLRRKTRALLAFLAVTGQAHSRQALMDMFFQGANAPARALAVLLSRIRKQVGAHVLHTNGGTVRLNFDVVWVDVVAFRRVLDRDVGRRPVEPVQTATTAALSAGVSLYRADLLNGLMLNDAPEFELWLLAERAQMRHLQERGLMRLVQQYIEQQQFEMALPYAKQLVQHNPLLEEAHAQMIWLYAHTGQRDAALTQYAQCRALLHQELAIEPGEALQSLVANLEGEWPLRLRSVQALPPYIVSKTITPAALSAGVSTGLKLATDDFVGRVGELAVLQTAWQQAQAGQGGVITIAAQAGGGKTRLVQELIGQVSETPALSVVEVAPAAVRSAGVLTARCYESSHALPYEPWLTLFEQHLQRLDDDTIDQLLPQTRTFMARLLPQLARRLPQLNMSEPTGTFVEMEQLYTAVIDFLTQPADTPTLFFLDDLQWADEASLRLFHYLTQRIERLPWLLIGTYRTEEATNSPALTLLIDDLSRRGLPRLMMAPFSVAEVAELAVHLWPQLAPGYRGHVAEMLAQATGGNALFVTAVLRELATSDTVPGDLPVPASVRELVLRRLRRLPEGCQQVLEGLAVLGTSATLTQLQHVSGRSVDEVAQAVELGLQWGLVVGEITVSTTQYQFHHDLVREAVLVTISAVRVQRLHHRSAVWLSHIAGHQPAAVQEEMAGRIIFHAQQGEAHSLLFQWSPIAAVHARHMFAYQDALALLEIGMDAFMHCQLDPDFDKNDAENTLFEMIVVWLVYCVAVGKPSTQIEAVYEQAKRLLKQHPTAVRMARFHLIEAELQLDFWQVDYWQAIQSAEAAHSQFMQLDQPVMAASALLSIARAYLSLSENKRSQRAYADALVLYRQAGDVAGEVQSLSGLGWVALNLGEVEAALHHLQQGLALSRQRGNRIGEAQTLFVLTAAWGFYHASDPMIRLAEESIAIYEEIGFGGRAIRPLLYIGLAHDMRGDVAQALSIYEKVLDQAIVLQDTWVIGWVSQLIGRIYLERGDVSIAAKHLQVAQQTRIQTGEVQNQVSDLAWLGRLALAQEDGQGALTFTEQAITKLDAFQGEFYVWEQPDVLMCRAEALKAAGDFDAAGLVMRRAQATMHQFAAQIEDVGLREGFLRYWRNVGVETAVWGE